MYVYISYSPAESFKKIDTFYEVTLRYTVKYKYTVYTYVDVQIVLLLARISANIAITYLIVYRACVSA